MRTYLCSGDGRSGCDPSDEPTASAAPATVTAVAVSAIIVSRRMMLPPAYPYPIRAAPEPTLDWLRYVHALCLGRRHARRAGPHRPRPRDRRARLENRAYHPHRDAPLREPDRDSQSAAEPVCCYAPAVAARATSYRSTAAAALTPSDSICPWSGSATSASHAPATRGRMPWPSEPSTSTTPPP